ncbi:NUDIX hydrolase [Liquorilactobacillus sicerae]|uniref:NUDIX hydrolase n=1 Tax=Liquorilactobacillus sicerae TaxID=1416943 RepID=UPI00247FF071|nr:NUDIX hydrolase [Liquorilactobacillus sicerae]
MIKDYIKYIRQLIGHKPVILTYAGGVLFNNKGEILLQKRSDFNKWGLIGGTIEYYETASEACIREFKEETGLNVTVTKFLGIDSSGKQKYPNGDQAKSILIFFKVQLLSGKLNDKNSETLELRFFPLDSLPQIFNDQHMRVLNNIKNNVDIFYD